ncbi:hypothetical protein EV182_000765 [Spiromyces aspiralis]|uniref:Uncharacterized protein n=1 Tax=Spiromyces aspiralis TaxID=68401 RepID=A0ACC1I1P9_9FUNG|nr:hypothetical protein EV182_000765 [Spiromyces aspiralis]
MGNSSGKADSIDQGLHLGQFSLLRCIGRGSFGKVRIVEHKATKMKYALKYINKDECIHMGALDHILRERELLVDIEHPFIVNLRYSFQDDYNMFMVLDLMTGGDLRYHLSRRRFSEAEIRIWIAELTLALNYLHQNSIIHRDVKPDNILMDAKGHVALTDFNIATRIIDDKKHYSAAGTTGYMAPELMRGQGYRYSADWWSLGVVMFECLYGRRPFSQRSRSNREESRFGPLVFPQSDIWISPDSKSLVKGLLEISVDNRLGCGPAGIDPIKNHSLFADLDWDRLLKKEIDPLFVPDSRASNFDHTYDLEELLLEQDPLEVRPRRKNKPGYRLSPEKERIEKEFLTFDYLEFERFRGYTVSSSDSRPNAENIGNNNDDSDDNSRQPKQQQQQQQQLQQPEPKPHIASTPDEPPVAIKPIDRIAWEMLSREQQDLAKRLSRASNRHRSPSLRTLNMSVEASGSQGLLTASERQGTLFKSQRSFGELRAGFPLDDIESMSDVEELNSAAGHSQISTPNSARFDSPTAMGLRVSR